LLVISLGDSFNTKGFANKTLVVHASARLLQSDQLASARGQTKPRLLQSIPI